MKLAKVTKLRLPLAGPPEDRPVHTEERTASEGGPYKSSDQGHVGTLGATRTTLALAHFDAQKVRKD
jgi:hypothetical protein